MAEGGNKVSKLSEEEICEGLRALNFPNVRLNDVKYPTREFIINVFDCFLHDLRFDITSPSLRTWESINHIEDADICEEGQLLVLLLMSINHIMSPCGLTVTMKDIVEPKPKRTKKILNYLLVFWSNYVKRYAKYMQVQERFEPQKKLLESLGPQNEALDEKYEDALKQLSIMQSDKDLPSVVAAKVEKEKKYKADYEKISAEYQALKSKEASLLDQIAATDLQISTAKERLNELSQLILSSPDRINAEIKNIEDRIKAEDAKIKDLENKHKDLIKNLKVQEEFKKEMEKSVVTLEKIKEACDNLSMKITDLKEINQKVCEEEEKVRQLESDLEQEQQGEFQQKQQSAKLVLNTRKQVETMKEVLKQTENYVIKEKEEVKALKGRIHNLQEQLDSESDAVLLVIEKLKEADAKTEERVSLHKSRLEEISSTFKSDCEEIVNSVKATLSANLKKDGE